MKNWLVAVGVFWSIMFLCVDVWTFRSNKCFSPVTMYKHISLCFSDGVHSHPCRAGFRWGAPMVLCCDWTSLLEGAQGAVLIAVPWRVPLQGRVAAEPAPRVSFSGAPWLRADGQTLEWAQRSWRRSHGAHSVRDAQETSVAAWYVAVCAALHELVVEMRLTRFLLDVCALGQRINLERFLRLQHVFSVFLCNHPALRSQPCLSTISWDNCQHFMWRAKTYLEISLAVTVQGLEIGCRSWDEGALLPPVSVRIIKMIFSLYWL